MSQTGIGILFGTILLVIPASLFAWSVFTKRGQAGWSNAARVQQGRFDHPPDPLDNRAIRWLAFHPWQATATALALEVALAAAAGWHAFGPMIQIAAYWALLLFYLVPKAKREQAERDRAR
jgi:hypothetical protein